MTYRRASPAETVHVISHSIRIDTTADHTLLEKGGVMDALTSRENLFASDEDFKGV